MPAEKGSHYLRPQLVWSRLRESITAEVGAFEINAHLTLPK